MRRRYGDRSSLFIHRSPEQNLDFWLLFRAVITSWPSPTSTSCSPIDRSCPASMSLFADPFLLNLIFLVSKHFDGDFESFCFLRDGVTFTPLTDISGKTLLRLHAQRRIRNAERSTGTHKARDALLVAVLHCRSETHKVCRASEDVLHPLG